MARAIVIYEIPDPEGLLEGEEHEQDRTDLQNWLEADIAGVSSIDSDHPAANSIIAVSVTVLSEEEYSSQNRSVWTRGAS